MVWLKTTIICGLFLALTLALALALAWPLPPSLRSEGNSVLNGRPIALLYARTPSEQFQGLSDRERICDSCGMLFAFPDKQPRTFVMRRMKFPLDIIWINDGRIVGMNLNLWPESAEPYTPYMSPEPVDSVLEMPAGSAEAYGLRLGMEAKLR